MRGARGAGAALGRPELRCQTSVSVSGAGAGRVQRAERGGIGGRRKKKGRERGGGGRAEQRKLSRKG